MISEFETRKVLIDKKLLAAGWDVADRTSVTPEFDISIPKAGTVSENAQAYSEHLYSDYVLLGGDGKPLAVVEAKKTSVDAEIGREQAKQYCHGIKKREGDLLPFCFYTNGHDIFFWDLDNYPPRKVAGFPTRDDLERYDYIRRYRKPLADEFIDTGIAGRDYQIKAIRLVLEGMECRRRDFLLVMATGTGKTRTCVALVDALMRAGWAERTLFLVDRIALRDQAVDAFKEHLPNEPYWPHEGEKTIARDRRIYVSTYPTMLNIVRDPSTPLSPHFFDLVVVDESHRSIYNAYKEVLEYFDAVRLGLTATPTDVIDHNTFRLFECQDGVPSFAFTYEEAVGHVPPYLCGFEVMKVRTKFQDEGISKRTISLEDQKRLILEGKEVAEIDFEGTELEKTVTNKGTNALIVREFMEEAVKDGSGVLPGKTIFFCTSKAHARRLERIFDSLFPEYRGELAKVLVSEDPRVYGKGGLLDQFKTKDLPRIALSVDMLDTGIDVRDIVNLVFAKPVYSYTKFWQMIGRGTRLLDPDRKRPWCLEKDRFLILDCWDNFEYFKLNPKGKTPTGQVPLPVRFAGIRIDKIEAAKERGRDGIAAKEIARLRVEIASLPAESIVIRDAAADLSRVSGEAFWSRLGPDGFVFLRSTIKPLFRTISQADFAAMRFRKDLLEASLVKLRDENDKLGTLVEGIAEKISELPLSVNTVAAESELIVRARKRHFWAVAEDADFDTVAERLGPLMRYRDGNGPVSGTVELDLRDVLAAKETVEFGPEREAASVSKYRELVEAFVTELAESDPSLRKIKAGEAVTEEELRGLADKLHEERPHVTEELLRRVYRNRKASLAQFLRHILGIERLETFPESVATAFDSFIAAHSYLSGRQLDFLALLRDYLLERERVDKRNLIEAPFTHLHPDGIRGLFSPAEIGEIVELTERLAS